jgi:hypothetical protein
MIPSALTRKREVAAKPGVAHSIAPSALRQTETVAALGSVQRASGPPSGVGVHTARSSAEEIVASNASLLPTGSPIHSKWLAMPEVYAQLCGRWL